MVDKNAFGERKVNLKKEKEEEKKGESKRIILILFMVTVILSIFFYIKGNFNQWLEALFGPSEWTITR